MDEIVAEAPPAVELTAADAVEVILFILEGSTKTSSV